MPEHAHSLKLTHVTGGPDMRVWFVCYAAVCSADPPAWSCRLVDLPAVWRALDAGCWPGDLGLFVHGHAPTHPAAVGGC